MHKKYLLAFLLFSVPSGLTLFFHAILGSYSRFMADDYCVAAAAKKMGLLKSTWYWYKNWSGGYSTSLVDYFLNFVGTKGISFASPVILIIWFVVTMCVVLHSLQKRTNIGEKFLAALTLTFLIIFITLTLTPNVPQSLYWWTGMRAYLLPIVIFTFYIALYQWINNRIWSKKEALLLCLVSFAITFLNSGFAETYTPIQFVFFAMAIALIVLTKKIKIGSTAFYFLLSGLIGSLVGLIAMVAAPGNSIRQGSFPPPPDLFNILRISADNYLIYIKYIFTNAYTVTGLFGVILGAAWFGTNDPGEATQASLLSLSIIAGFFFAFLCFPSSAYGLSGAPPPRALTFFAFAIGTFFIMAGYFAGAWLSTKTKISTKPVVTMGLLITSTLLIGYSSWFSVNYMNRSKPYFESYAQVWDENHVKILNTERKGNKIVVIEPLYNWAQLQDPTNDRNYSINKCMNDYYGIFVVTK